MARGKKQEATTEISVLEIEKSVLTFHVLGSSPIILNSMSSKARRQLLLPSGRKTAADKAVSLKHDPLAEYRDSPYTNRDPSSPVLLEHLGSAFKGALADVAKDLPGMARTQIARLVWAEDERVGIYGVPQLFMSVVRSADINHTPDIRTRAIVPRWAAKVRMSFVRPIMTEHAVATLFAAAGMMRGVGDWRSEKGAGSYGSFTLVGADDAEWQRIVETGGRAAQLAAMESPGFYDAESEELYRWYETEIVRRKGGGKNGKPVEAAEVAEVAEVAETVEAQA